MAPVKAFLSGGASDRRKGRGEQRREEHDEKDRTKGHLVGESERFVRRIYMTTRKRTKEYERVGENFEKRGVRPFSITSFSVHRGLQTGQFFPGRKGARSPFSSFH